MVGTWSCAVLMSHKKQKQSFPNFSLTIIIIIITYYYGVPSCWSPKRLQRHKDIYTYAHFISLSLTHTCAHVLTHTHAHYKYMHYKTIRLFWQMLSKILYPMMKPRHLKMPTRPIFHITHSSSSFTGMIILHCPFKTILMRKTLRHFGGQPGSLMCTVPHY